MFDYFYGQSGEMFSYFRVPKILFRDIKFKDLSTDAKTLYSDSSAVWSVRLRAAGGFIPPVHIISSVIHQSKF